MIKIVTDGSADMPADWIDRYSIHVLPLRVTFGEQSFTQGDDIDHAGFYQRVEQTGIIPKTTLPSPHQLAEFYRQVARPGDQVISIHVGRKLSGTFDVAQAAARELIGELEIIPFDSAAGSAAIGFMARAAAQCAQIDLSTDKIIQRLEAIRENLTIIFTVDRLEFARMSGRVTVIQSTVASLLHIKPILILKDGLLEMSDRARTRSGSISRVLETVSNRVGRSRIRLAVVHANAPEIGKQVLERAINLFNSVDPFLVDLSIPVAAHLGPGAVGIVAYPVEMEGF